MEVKETKEQFKEKLCAEISKAMLKFSNQKVKTGYNYLSDRNQRLIMNNVVAVSKMARYKRNDNKC